MTDAADLELMQCKPPRRGRVYAYVRASTNEQIASPHVQLEIIRQAAKRIGATIDAEFIDAPIRNPDGSWNDAESGKVFIAKRKAGGELTKRLQRGDLMIVAKIDRAFRSLADMAMMLDRWERRGVKVLICDAPAEFDISNPMGKAMVQMMGVFAELAVKLTSIRTKEALALRKRRGHANGCYPGYGFKWEKRWDKDQGKRVKVKVADPDERRVMDQIARWRGEGQTWDEITRRLSGLNLKTKHGSPWSRARVVRAYEAARNLRCIEGDADGASAQAKSIAQSIDDAELKQS